MATLVWELWLRHFSLGTLGKEIWASAVAIVVQGCRYQQGPPGHREAYRILDSDVQSANASCTVDLEHPIIGEPTQKPSLLLKTHS